MNHVDSRQKKVYSSREIHCVNYSGWLLTNKFVISDTVDCLPSAILLYARTFQKGANEWINMLIEILTRKGSMISAEYSSTCIKFAVLVVFVHISASHQLNLQNSIVLISDQNRSWTKVNVSTCEKKRFCNLHKKKLLKANKTFVVDYFVKKKLLRWI